MTTRKNHYPIPRAVPGEPYVLAHYAPMMAVRGAIRDQSGNGLDIGTRVGAPLVAQGTGVFIPENAAVWWNGPTISMGTSLFRYVAEYEFPAVPVAALPVVFQNGGGNHAHYISNAGLFLASVTGGASTIATAYSLAGRGPFRVGQRFDGTNHSLDINGRQAATAVHVPLATAAGLAYYRGFATRRRHKFVSGAPVSEAIDRADYVREFARQILWQWTPHREIASIATGTTGGDDDWWCPLGAATMGIVWRTDLSAPGGGRLALTDSQTVNLNRIEFPFRRPWFGSILIEYQVRDPATDNMVVAFAPTRGVDPTAAGSGAYWSHTRTVAGPWWRSSVYLANGAQIDAADAAFPGPVANDRCKILLTRAVDGTIQVYQQTPTGWWWSATTGNDVTVLSEGFISIAPRGAYVERVTYYQGEMTPHELEVP